MKDCRQFYIDGTWTDPAMPCDFPVVNPATEESIAAISLGSAADVDKAVCAAKKAFVWYSETSVGERLALLQRIITIYKSRMEEMAETISREMGAPLTLSRAAQAPAAARGAWPRWLPQCRPQFHRSVRRGRTRRGRGGFHR